MGRLVNHIWEANNDELKLKPLTGKIVKKAEEQFKVKLPNSYLEILKEQNGGYIIYNAHPSPVPTVWGGSFITIDHIKGIGNGEGILENDYFIKEWDMPEGLILINGDGHTWIAFDYRNCASEPPIVYVDNESEQIIQVADGFQEFLNHLYNEEAEIFEDDEFHLEEYSEQDFEKIIQQNNLDEMIRTLMQLSQSDVDMDWFGNQLLGLSQHPNKHIRAEVAENVWNFLTYRLGDKTLNTLLKNFESDGDPEVQMFADMIKEKMNYSFDDFKRDIKMAGMVSFIYKNETYHVNEHSGQWHLSDFQADLQSFHSADELVEQATIEGKPLRDIWEHIKKV